MTLRRLVPGMGIDKLGVEQVRLLVSEAGGTPIVAAALKVRVEDVVGWARFGLTDADKAMALKELADLGRRLPGAKRRCMLVTTAELERFVARVGSGQQAAVELGISEHSFCLYRRGHRALPESLVERVLARIHAAHSPSEVRATATTSAQQVQELVRAHGGLRGAAKALGVSRSALQRYAVGKRVCRRLLVAPSSAATESAPIVEAS